MISKASKKIDPSCVDTSGSIPKLKDNYKKIYSEAEKLGISIDVVKDENEYHLFAKSQSNGEDVTDSIFYIVLKISGITVT